jgi:excisionase family DNA binding protein
MSELKIIEGGKGLMDMGETASFLGSKKSTLYQKVMRKTIPHIKLGRLVKFRPEDLTAYINKNLVEAQA